MLLIGQSALLQEGFFRTNPPLTRGRSLATEGFTLLGNNVRSVMIYKNRETYLPITPLQGVHIKSIQIIPSSFLLRYKPQINYSWTPNLNSIISNFRYFEL